MVNADDKTITVTPDGIENLAERLGWDLRPDRPKTVHFGLDLQSDDGNILTSLVTKPGGKPAYDYDSDDWEEWGEYPKGDYYWQAKRHVTIKCTDLMDALEWVLYIGSIDLSLPAMEYEHQRGTRIVISDQIDWAEDHVVIT